MSKSKFFRYRGGKIRMPVFFPDATRAVLRTVDAQDIKNSKTKGVLVNTYHLNEELGRDILEKFGSIGNFMGWSGAIISDSGGFQIMSLVKSSRGKGKITDKGVLFKHSKKKVKYFTPEQSIRFQMKLGVDMVVVLDDFTKPNSSFSEAKKTVDRTIEWAKRSKKEFERLCKLNKTRKKDRPYLLGVVQGGDYLDLRRECARGLIKIGFDGFGYGGWPLKDDGEFNLDVAKVIAEEAPTHYLLFGLGIGKPEDIVALSRLGYDIFDCVLPTRDARHGRLYVYNASSIDKINPSKKDFYSFFFPGKERYKNDDGPISEACDCLLCTNYKRAYLNHLFRINETSALRLSTIHNLRFYSLLMEKLRKK
jgi:queuine tRNA-ribosyltransferase